MATTRLFYDRNYTAGFYFNKGKNPAVFISKMKTLLHGEWTDNICRFKSKDVMEVLNSKLESYVKKATEESLINIDCFSNFRLSFVNTKSVTLYSELSDPTIDIDTFSDAVKLEIKSIVADLPESVKNNFKLDNTLETCTYLNDRKKILISVNENTYLALCIALLQRVDVLTELKSYTNDQKQTLLSKEHNDNLELFSFTLKGASYGFNEYLNICKKCLTTHAFESPVTCLKKLCRSCGGAMERDHVCEKSKTCKLCSLYLRKTSEHSPLSTNCLHLKNMENLVFANTRQLRLKDFIETICNCETYSFEKDETSSSEKCDDYGLDRCDGIKLKKERRDTFVLNSLDFPYLNAAKKRSKSDNDISKPSRFDSSLESLGKIATQSEDSEDDHEKPEERKIKKEKPEERKIKKEKLDEIFKNLEFMSFNLLKDIAVTESDKTFLKSAVGLNLKQLQFQVEEIIETEPLSKDEGEFTVVIKNKKRKSPKSN